MGYKEFTSSFSNATAELTREWIGRFIQGWKDAGLVQTSDTGQIVPETLALAPSTGLFVFGYAMFRFDDDLQSTAPVFIKVTFVSHSGPTSSPRFEVSIGKSTDGAGNLGGILLPVTAVGFEGGSHAVTTTRFMHYAASGPGWFGFLPFVNSVTTSHAGSLIIERSRSATGGPTGAGLMVAIDHLIGTRPLGTTNGGYGMVAVYAFNYQTGAYVLGTPPVTFPYSINGAPLSQSNSLAAGSIGPVFPWVLVAPGCAPWQSCAILSIPSGDYPGTTFTTTLCGVSSTFRPVAASPAHAGWGLALVPNVDLTPRGSNYVGPAIRWEA